ncbi:MAG: glutamate--cysteine ligase [Actinomycetia bacterium]|nr:glutamate--cysteine ligase [Actinomycetes bacterium]
MGLEFNPSPRRSLGVEIELGIVDRQTGQLVPASNEIIGALTDRHQEVEHPKAKHELFLSTIEIITGVNLTAAQARDDLAATVSEVSDELDKHGLALIGGGVHPFADPKTLVRSPSERYDQLVNRIRWPAERLQIHGTHFHVGVGDADKVIHIMNHLTGFLPHFIALSASSPFWESEETGLASVRSKIFEAMPTAGLPSLFADWEHYAAFIDAMIASSSIHTVREIWWDLRPHALYGTLEFRMCDSLATLRETAALAALAQCLVDYLDQAIDDRTAPAETIGWVVRENKWRAARYGLDAELIDQTGAARAIKDDIRDWLSRLQPTATKLNCVAELADINTILSVGGSYARQRAVLDESGSLSDVVQSLMNEFSQDVIQ